MYNRVFRVRVVLPVIGALLTGSILLTGCKSDAQMSDKDVAQFKEGPPKEMPEQAKKMFEQANQQGHGAPAGGQAGAAPAGAKPAPTTPPAGAAGQ